MAAGLLDLDLFCRFFVPVLSGKLRGESLPNCSNFRPEFCPDLSTIFFVGIFRALLS